VRGDYGCTDALIENQKVVGLLAYPVQEQQSTAGSLSYLLAQAQRQHTANVVNAAIRGMSERVRVLVC
jgi:hypothetical protein